jgi:hypothetical protein
MEYRMNTKRALLSAASVWLLVMAGMVLPAPAFASTFGWIDQCPSSSPSGVPHHNNDDPIVYPGVQNATHLHEYNGNLSTNYASTINSMLAAGSSCPSNTQDTAGYWIPAVMNSGIEALPCTSQDSASPRCTNYYRDDNLSSAYLAAHPPRPFPPGFKMVAGKARATSVADNPELGHELYYGCSDNSESGKPTAPVDCATGIMTVHIGFPNCWNGADASNDTGLFNSTANTLAYPSSGVCPSAFPYVLPRVIERWEIPVGTNAASAITLSSGPTYTLHGDYWSTWQPGALESLVTHCLDATVDCGNDPTPSASPPAPSPSPSPSATSTPTASPSPSPSPTNGGPGFAFGGRVGTVQGSMTTASIPVPAGGVPAGSLLVVGIATATAPESFVVSDSATNGYTLDNSRTASSPYGYQFHALATAPLPPGATISVRWGGAGIDAVIEAVWFSTRYPSVGKDVSSSGHGSGTALSTGNTTATAYPNELVVGMGGPRMPGTVTYTDDSTDGFSQALFTGDSQQSNDLSYKTVPSTGVFNYNPAIGVASSWVALLTTYHGS